MGQYDVQQVCLNGHQITDCYYSSPEFRADFCTTCGEKTITKCPSCGKEIKGDYFIEGVVDLTGSSTPVPDICEYCGKDFPWRQKKSKVLQTHKQENQDSRSIVEMLCNRFHLIAKQIWQRHDDRETLDIKDEYDTQDLLHALLRIYFDDIRPEEWNPSYAGSSTRSDFLIKGEKIIIEVKKTRNNLKAKEIGQQLIIDIAHYKNHPDCKILFCFVYDPDGYIVNPKGIENDLSNSENNFQIKVIIIPKGQ